MILKFQKYGQAQVVDLKKLLCLPLVKSIRFIIVFYMVPRSTLHNIKNVQQE